MVNTREFENALEAHAKGDLEKAWAYYSAALAAGEQAPTFFQNYGALARQRQEIKLAISLYSQGLSLHPANPGIIANRVNLIKDEKPIQAVADLVFSLCANPDLIESWLTLLLLLYEQGCFAWALEIVKAALSHHPGDSRLWYRALTLMVELGDEEDEYLTQKEDQIIDIIDNLMKEMPQSQGNEMKIVMASYGQSRNRTEIAKKYFSMLTEDLLTSEPKSQEDRAERERLFHMSSWNYSNYLLSQQDFKLGWQLYDHGLCTPCDHKNGQQWQRALHKPFHAEELSLWRGEQLDGKRLLLLAEQGVGDTIAFLSLLPTLEQEGALITVLTSDRLCKSYSLFSPLKAAFIKPSDIAERSIKPNDFDFQAAIGSICQYHFQHPSHFAPQTPMLAVPNSKKQVFRDKYNVTGSSHKLIGFSWRGGASKQRKREKSLELQQIVQLLQPRVGIKFVSLQYGDIQETIKELKDYGIDLIHDPDIDAIHGFSTWLEQASACDAVLSVANTTIHAAGSLGIPTLCLLGRNSDWRWLTDQKVVRSYWYKSVGITRQSTTGNWSPAIEEATRWLESGCPLPEGPAWMG